MDHQRRAWTSEYFPNHGLGDARPAQDHQAVAGLDLVVLEDILGYLWQQVQCVAPKPGEALDLQHAILVLHAGSFPWCLCDGPAKKAPSFSLAGKLAVELDVRLGELLVQ
jgi:hypothetical protein